MGTHPIFESDFDCLTARMADRRMRSGDHEISLERKVQLIEEENAKLRSKLSEQAKEIEELREENRYLKLPSAARKRERDRQHKAERSRRQQISDLKDDLRKTLDNRRGSISVGSSFTSTPSSTSASTPNVPLVPEVTFEPTKEYDILEEKPSRHTILWSDGYLKSDGDFYRRSQGQMQALKESLINDAPESTCSEESANLETPEYRITEAVADSSGSSDLEDISDAAFQKRHQKLENKEKILVSADKKQQADLLNKRLKTGSESRTCQEFLRLYSSRALREIEITDEIPLTIFGALVPALSEADFKLPWLTTQADLRKEKMMKRSSTGRR